MASLALILILMMITIHGGYLVHKLYKRRRSAPSSLPLPPGPTQLPVLGNLLNFVGQLRRNPHRALARLAKTYGPVASFRPGTASLFVVVSSPGAAREALAENDAALAGRYAPDSTRALGHASASIFFLPSSDPLWRRNRLAVAAHLASARGLEATRRDRERHARRLAEHLRARSGQEGAPVGVGELVFRVMLNAVSGALFSRDLVELDERAGGQVFRDLIVAVMDEWSRPSVSDAFPFLAPLDLLGPRRRAARALAKLFRFLDQEIIDRRLASGQHHGDQLDVLLAQHAKSELTRSDITNFIVDIFISGSITNMIPVEWALAHLLRRADKMEKVRSELEANLSSKDFPEESDLDKLPYLQAVVKEALRLHPPGPLVPRKVVADGLSLDGFCVPKDTNVIVNLWAIGRDPAAWPEPDEFLPERFLGDEAPHFRGSDDFSYRPFGAGRRMCPGIDLVQRFVPLVLASILHKLEWTLPDGMAPEELDMRDHYGTLLQLATPLRAVARRQM